MALSKRHGQSESRAQESLATVVSQRSIVDAERDTLQYPTEDSTRQRILACLFHHTHPGQDIRVGRRSLHV